MRFQKILFMSLLIPFALLGQGRSGTESQSFGRIATETNKDIKIERIEAFEHDFPQSKNLARVYLMAVDVYRELNDRKKINEYGEKVLRIDDKNVTAMMLLARSYAMETRNLNRAVDLAQRALARLRTLRREETLPRGLTVGQWKSYLRSSEDSAERILQYVNEIKIRSKRPATAERPAGTAATATPQQVRSTP